MNNTSSLSYFIGTFFFTISLGWVIFIYYLIRKKLVDDVKLDKMIDLGKWFMISVAMVLGATIVTDSFKEREQDMKEMEVFDKYVSTITQVKGIEPRWLLCQYFATVSPAGHLKESWENYLKLLEPDYQKYMANQQIIVSLTNKDSLTTTEEKKLKIATQVTEALDKSLISSSTTAVIDRRIDIDIFYLEGHPELEKRAHDIDDQIPASDYNVHIKMLKKATNERIGYQITTNQIRIDSATEQQKAEALNKELELGYLIKRGGSKPTPFYISIFIVK